MSASHPVSPSPGYAPTLRELGNVSATSKSAVKHWVLRKNCSLSPRQVLLLYLSLSVFSFAIAGIFVFTGLWLVLPFCVINNVVLAAALLYYARHALDRECVSLVGGALRIDVIRGQRTVRYDFNANWTRLEWSGRRNDILWMRHGRDAVRVGTFLTPARRRRFASEFGAAVERLRTWHEPAPLPAPVRLPSGRSFATPPEIGTAKTQCKQGDEVNQGGAGHHG